MYIDGLHKKKCVSIMDTLNYYRSTHSFSFLCSTQNNISNILLLRMSFRFRCGTVPLFAET